jgi:hypothetical protein
MNQQYVYCATRIIGELEVRYNWASAKNNPREAVINVWSLELSRFNISALNQKTIAKAIQEWDIDCNGKPPVVGQFMKILRRLTYDHQHRQLNQLESSQTENIDWIGMFDRCDNKGKFGFFVKYTNASPLIRNYAKEWFEKNTRFTNNAIYNITNGKITT